MKAIGFGVAAALSCLLVTASAEAQDAKRLITFEEMFNMENLGGAAFSPDGQWLSFTREVPPTRQPSWGYIDGSRLRTRLFVAHSNGEGLQEIPSTTDVRYAPVPGHLWSPDGRGLALVASARDGYGLAYYDLASQHITAIPGRPVWATMEWLPDGRILVPEIAEGQRQRDVSATLLDSLEKHWRDGWTSSTPEVTVSSPSDVFPDRPEPLGELVVFNPGSGSRLTLAKGNFATTNASPDGRHIAAIDMAEHLSDASSGQSRRGELQIFELDGGKARALLRDQTVDMALNGSLAWSPSGDRLLFVGRPLRDAQGHAIDYGRSLQDGMRLYEFDVRSRKVRLLSSENLFQGNVDLNDLNVLPIGWMGGRPIAISMRHVQGATSTTVSGHATLDYGFTRDTRFDLFAFGGGGEPENLTAFAKASVQQFIAPKGADFAYVVADGALWKVASGKPAQRMTQADAPRVVAFGVDHGNPSPPLESAYYRAGPVERISLMTFSGQNLGRETLDLATGKLISQPAPADTLATAPDELRTLTKATDGWATSVDLNDGAAKTLVTINAELKDRAIAPVERFTYAYKGQTLTGWVVLPTGSKPGKKLPAIVSVYGGAVYADQPPFFTRTDLGLPVFSGQLLAQQGYAVIYPSTPLGAGADTDLMATLADETIAAIDALAAKGTIDPTRVGVTGQSFGGFSTAAILAERSDRFRAGVAMAGVYDWMHGYGLRSTEAMFNDDDNMDAREAMLIESGQSRLEKPFWQAPDAYMRNSPIFRADKMDAPLLLLHGDLDLAVTGLTGAERLYNALLRAGKHPTLVHYWGEGHVAQSDWAIRDQWMRLTTWFAYYVKGEKHAGSAGAANTSAPQ